MTWMQYHAVMSGSPTRRWKRMEKSSSHCRHVASTLICPSYFSGDHGGPKLSPPLSTPRTSGSSPSVVTSLDVLKGIPENQQLNKANSSQQQQQQQQQQTETPLNSNSIHPDHIPASVKAILPFPRASPTMASYSTLNDTSIRCRRLPRDTEMEQSPLRSATATVEMEPPWGRSNFLGETWEMHGRSMRYEWGIKCNLSGLLMFVDPLLSC